MRTFLSSLYREFYTGKIKIEDATKFYDEDIRTIGAAFELFADIVKSKILTNAKVKAYIVIDNKEFEVFKEQGKVKIYEL